MKSNNDFKNILDKETISLAEKDRKDKDKGKNFFINKEYNAKTRFILIVIIIISISFNIIISFKYKKSETNKLNKNLTNFKNKEINHFNKINLQINKPFLPIETEDILNIIKQISDIILMKFIQIELYLKLIIHIFLILILKNQFHMMKMLILYIIQLEC